MDLLQREVLEDVVDPARLDVVLQNQRQGLGRVAGAERALVVGELDEDDRRVGVAGGERAVIHLGQRLPVGVG